MIPDFADSWCQQQIESLPVRVRSFAYLKRKCGCERSTPIQLTCERTGAERREWPIAAESKALVLIHWHNPGLIRDRRRCIGWIAGMWPFLLTAGTMHEEERKLPEWVENAASLISSSHRSFCSIEQQEAFSFINFLHLDIIAIIDKDYRASGLRHAFREGKCCSCRAAMTK